MLEAGGILSLSNYSWTVGLQIVLLGTHGLHYLFPFVGKFLLEAVGILSLSNYSWTLELDCFVRHAWFALPVFSRDGIFLLEAVGILRLCKFSLKMRLDFVLLRTHGVHYLFACVMENSWLRQVEF